MARKKKSYGEWVRENYGAAKNDYADAVRAIREANDIAPITPSPLQEEKEEDSWFKAGAFADDEGDWLTDTLASVGSTIGDVASGVAQGFLGLGEGVVDLLLHGGSAVVGAFGWEDGKNALKDAAQYGIVENAFNPIDDFFDENSFLGNKTEGIEESLGQIAAIMLTGGAGAAAGLSTAGTTALTTGVTAASSMGGGINEAYAGGATDAEAWSYGAWSGAVDAGTELLFGGLGKTVKAVGLSKGISSLDDMFAKKLSSGISNTVAKNLVQFGVKSSAEGFEEYLAYYGEAIGKKLTYMSEEELSEIANNDEALEAFLVGTITSSMAQSGVVPGMKKGSLIDTTKKGEDFITNLTQNEQKVVDMEVAKRVDEKEKRSGKELSKKEKNAIYDQVIEDLDRGEISIETIEEVLGGDNYKAYQDAVASDKALIDEYEELGKKQGATLAEQERFRELHGQMKDIKADTRYDELKGKLKQSAFDTVKADRKGEGSRLLSSYAEVSKRGKAFEADVKSYDEKYRATVQRAIDSGILNNTRSAHTFVELVAKMEADKGVKFDFLNNKKLKESGFAIDGKVVNGYYNRKNNTIGINIQSSKALNATVGHEVTHVLEGTELYADLQKALFEYAEAKGELKSRREALSQHYKEADIDSELVADLVGDYLFTDEAFVKHLSAKNRNVFQKIFDEIKYLCKIATAGSKEKRQLEEIKHLFEQVYKADVKANAKTDNKAQYSVSNKNPLDKYRKNSYNLYNAIYEYGQPFPYKLPSDFPRRLANKTTGMVDGEIRTIYVSGYIFEADGYMHGRILAPYNSKTKKLLGERRFEYERIDEDREIATVWFETVQDAERGSGGDIGVSRRGRSSADDRLLGESLERHSSGDNERVRQTLETKAEIDEIVKKLREMMGLDAKTSSETLEQTQSNEIAPTKASSNDGVFFDAENTKFSLSADSNTNTNGAVYNGKEFWLGVADLDGNIVQTWTYEEAESRGFDLDWDAIFNDKLRDGYRFFTTDLIEDNGRIEFDDYGDRLPDNMIERINEQIKVKPTTKPAADIDATTLMEYLNESLRYADSGSQYKDVASWVEGEGARSVAEDLLLDHATEYGSNIPAHKWVDALFESGLDEDAVLERVEMAINESVNGGTNDDIRFSLSKPVEETKDLVALHNVHTDKLMEALRLGGLPMPSVAITKSDILHDNYGSITLILQKDAIDPQADSRNKVYGSDAWTPTISNARTEYEVDFDKMRAFEKKLAELSQKTAGGAFSSDSLVRRMGVEDVSEQNAARLAERLSNSDEVRAAYLAEMGQTIEPEYKTKEYNKFGNKALQTFVDKVGVEKLASLAAESKLGNTNAIQAEEDTVRKIIRDAYAEKHSALLNRKPEIKEMRLDAFMEKNVHFFTIEDFIDNAWTYYQEGGAVTEEVDRLATSGKLRQAVNDADVRAWLEPQIAEFLGEPGIYNGKDPFTADGRSRSFADTHYTYTAENIVKAMRNASARGEGTFGANANALVSTATPSYGSIEEMHADKGRLRIEEEADYDHTLRAIDEALTDIEYDIMRTTKHHADNTYDEQQIIGSIIVEAAIGKRTVAAVQRAFAKEDYKISTEQAKKILDLYNEAANIPTGYFEAKPERVVGFDEVGVFVIPRNADVKLKQELLNRGYAIAEYDPDVEGDRQKVVNSFEEYKFSLSNVGETPTEYGDFNIYGKDIALEAPIAEDIAPVAEDIAPVTKAADTAIDEDEWVSKDIAPVADTGIIPNETRVYAGDRGNIGTVKGYNEETNEYSVFFQAKNGNTATVNISADDIAPLVENKADEEFGEEEKVARVLEEEPEVPKKERKILNKIRAFFVDKGSVVEDLALKTGNRELDAKYNFMHYSESRAQSYIAKHLKPIVDAVEKTGKQNEFETYAYHLHNIDRMSLESKAQERIAELKGKFGLLRLDQIKAIAATKITEKTTERTAQTIREAKEYLNALETKNKPVYGDSVTADVSREVVKKLEAENPEFKELAKAYTEYNNALRKMLVDGGVISQQTADLWAKMYPHYMPIRRDGKSKLGITVPLDTNKTGVNAPIKQATGGNSDILPLSNTMAIRTQQTFKAIARNSFGIELMHTLDSVVDSERVSVDEVMDGFENHDELLKEGKRGQNPTFTVFENGQRVTFEISADMYDALKPTSEGLKYTNKVLSKLNNLRRGLITEFNPVFMLTNPIKDAQDVLMNSQHARLTYKNFPKAIAELWTKGKWYTEYMENGGEDNTYFDGKTNKFAEDAKGIKKLIGIPLNKISDANNFIERIPRLAEYIASRESGASIESAMLDAARVTTNFAAGGDVTKMLNRNGATFLNASVQGAAQQIRNLREAKAKGVKGVLHLAAKFAVAGLPAVLLNHLLWGDDEEYEDLSDYVKDNYYIVAKYGDGQFVRIPKGRTLAVIQDAFEQMGNMLTGNDEVDLANFGELLISNLAPNNPLDNNIIAPIAQAMSNKTWYGEDLVPTRLQDLPEAEQFDESTDALSKWLGETLNISPYKINYVLDQYSGALGDIFLPMWTPEADGGGLLAPLADKFTTDSVLNNQNVADFYDAMDELTKKANSMYATDEDVLAYKYMSTINSELGELYGQKREIQNSNLSDSAKDEAIRSLQEKINTLARGGLSSYGNAVSGGSAVVGDKLYGEYSLAKSVGGYKTYKSYSSDLYDIKADKDSNGKTISGSRKKKVIEYIKNLDADYGTKILLYKKEYPSDNRHNMDIIEYLNSREDISYKEMEAILKELGFTVRADGSIAWD